MTVKKLPKSVAKTCYLGVRVSPTYLTKLKRLAVKANMPTGIYVRWVIGNHMDQIEEVKKNKTSL